MCIARKVKHALWHARFIALPSASAGDLSTSCTCAIYPCWPSCRRYTVGLVEGGIIETVDMGYIQESSGLGPERLQGLKRLTFFSIVLNRLMTVNGAASTSWPNFLG